MTTVTIEIDINASPQRTFETFTNLPRMGEVVTAINKMEILTDGPVGVGTRFSETRTMMGKQATEEMEVTQFDPPSLFVHEAKSHGCHYISTYRFEPVGEGTKVTLTFEGRALTFGAKLMTIALGWMMKGAIRKCVGADFNDLKGEAESQPASASA